MFVKRSLKRIRSIVFLCVISTAGLTNAEVSQSKGIGPVSEIKLDAPELTSATKGYELFKAKCSMCHKMEERYVGPKLGDVLKRRKPEWIANMILNPLEMTQKDEVAKELFGEFLVQMTFQNVTKDEAILILSYFNYYAEKGEVPTATKPTPDLKAKPKAKQKSTQKNKGNKP